MKKCGLYLRVSTQMQVDVKAGSLDTQEEKLISFVNLKNSADEEWKVFKVFREEGRSGKDTDRSRLQELLADIEKGLINTVLVVRIDRITRSSLDFYKLFDFFQEHKIDFISLNESFDTSTPTGRVIVKIIVALAELEREQTSERIKDKMLWRAQQGFWNGATPLGYDLDSENKGILCLNKEEAELVNLIFNIYLKTGSLDRTAAILNEKGYRGKEYVTKKGKLHKGHKFNRVSVSRILRSPTYIGSVRHKGDAYPGKHQAIVSDELFERVNKLLDKNKNTRTNYKEEQKHNFLLRGLLKCGRCESSMYPKTSGGRSNLYFYYRCSKNDFRLDDRCVTGYVPAEDIEDAVVREIKKVGENLDLMDEVIKDANRDGEEKIAELKKRKKTLERKLPSLEKEINTGRLWFRKNAPDTEKVYETGMQLMRDLEEIHLQKKQVAREIEYLGLDIQEYEKKRLDATAAHDALVKFTELFEIATDEQKASLLNILIEKVVLYPDKIKIYIYGDLGERTIDSGSGNPGEDGAPSVTETPPCDIGFTWWISRKEALPQPGVLQTPRSRTNIFLRSAGLIERFFLPGIPLSSAL